MATITFLRRTTSLQSKQMRQENNTQEKTVKIEQKKKIQKFSCLRSDDYKKKIMSGNVLKKEKIEKNKPAL